MKPRSDKPLPHITEHRSEISNARVHNSRLAVNRVIPDVLYSIFVLAVYDSTFPVNTTLNISRVCDHWRKSVLGWPTLWAFVNLDSTGSILDMCMDRSVNAPLALSWSRWRQRVLTDFLEPKANLILPRLFSLTLHLTDSEFDQTHHVFRNSKELQLLQLRHLEIHVYTSLSSKQIALPLLEDLLRIDLSCLRVLKLEAMGLPLSWLDLQVPNTKLTHFTLIYPPNPPALSQLLRFLYRCPLLCDLEFYISDFKDVKVDIAAATTKSITRLDFPYLRRLVLKSDGPSSYSYIRELSTRVRTGTLLSKFCLLYDHHLRSGHRQSQSTTDTIPPPPLNIFEAIPSGVLSCFARHRYLYIDIDFEAGSFRISSAPDRIRRSGYPLDVLGSFPRGPLAASFDHLTPILDLIHSMPGITQLELGTQAWKVPWIIDIPNSFPCVDTLGLKFYRCFPRENLTSPLNSIPAGSKLKKLILTHIEELKKSSANALLRAVSRTGAEYVELWGLYDERTTEDKHIKRAEAALRKSGVVVFRPKK